MSEEGRTVSGEKIENQLQMALETTYEERRKSRELNVGYSRETDTWELFVKYYDTLEPLEEGLSAQVVTLLNNYAVVTVPAESVERLTEYPQVLYVEKPKNYFFALDVATEVACVASLRSERLPIEERLTGAGTLVAVFDSGLDCYHPDFRNADGTTRIVALWDQDGEYDGNRYGIGRIYTESSINEALSENAPLPGDRSGHGTGVAGVAAGNGRASGGRYQGVAPEAGLVIVKLSEGDSFGFAKTTSILYAVDFALRVSGRLAKPIAMNLSYGNNYGAHDGHTLLEEYLNEACLVYRNAFAVGTGNEGTTNRHGRVVLPQSVGREAMTGTENVQEIRAFAIAEGETAVSLQIWKNYYDTIELALVAPSGNRYVLRQSETTERFREADTELLVLYGDAKPYTSQQEVYIEFLPTGSEAGARLQGGVWQVEVSGRVIREGTVDMWLPAGGSILPDTEFLLPEPETTLTVPSSAERVISVAAYNGNNGIYAAFSGRGYERGGARKPDLCAPGVNIYTASPGGSYSRRSGTSFATPFVAGAAALLMEYGIVQGRDPFLYGEKLKAMLIAGARPLGTASETEEVPSPLWGWGALCVADSLRREREN